MDVLSNFTGWLKKHWKDVKSNWRNTDDPMSLGLAWSKAFVAFVVLLAVLPNSADDGWEFRLWTFITSPPNEIGDTLAGIAGALAFLWIIVTVQLQSKELKAQREELELARGEYAKMAEAQGEQVKLMTAQAEIFKKEQQQREEARAEQLLNEKLRSFIVGLVESPSKGLCWVFSSDTIHDEFGGFGDIHNVSLSSDKYENQTVDEATIDFRRRLPHIRESLWDLLHQSADYRLPDRAEDIQNLAHDLESILAMEQNLSAPQKERLSRLRIPEIVDQLQRLDATPELWKEAPQ